MSFIGKAISNVGKAIGIIPKTPALPAVASTPATMVPTANSLDASAQMDAQAVAAARAMQGGKTSTMLTGGMGEDETKLNTSKVLLGS